MEDKKNIYSYVSKCNSLGNVNNNNKKNNKKISPKMTTTVICRGDTGPTGPAGLTGVIGLSDYEIALANGFVGTIEEWRDSLTGDAGGPAIRGGLIPYTGILESLYTTSDDAVDFRYAAAFVSFSKDVRNAVDIDDITTFDTEEMLEVFGFFVTPKDIALIGASMSASGQYSTSGNIAVNIYAKVFISPQNSTIFTSIEDSTLKLLPTVTTSGYATIASGYNEYYYEIPAGTKIAMVMYVDYVGDDIGDYADWNGNVAGGLNYIELV